MYNLAKHWDIIRIELSEKGSIEKHLFEAVLQATSTEEIAAVVKICNENKIPVTTRGAATGLAGGCVPVYGGIVIETIKMNKILSYDLENFSVTIEPGVLLKDLAEDALTKGMMYPPDPGEKLATVGGNVSTNAGGMRAVKYGCTRDYVLAMKVVLPTGEITSFGAKVSKTSSGYSLLNLMIGSEGTLGIITELTLKLIPAPVMTLSLFVFYDEVETAISTVPISPPFRRSRWPTSIRRLWNSWRERSSFPPRDMPAAKCSPRPLTVWK